MKTKKSSNKKDAILKSAEANNIAAMREAVEFALIVVRGIIDGTLARHNQSVFDCRDKLKSALTNPPRNCDRDLSDRKAIFEEFRRWVHVSSLGCTSEPSASDAFEWLLAPVTE